MRYFVELAYKGTPFHGWQTQPQKVSVQEVLEDAFSRMLRIKISIVGCGRTDAGVHASQFIAHFDYNGELPRSFVERLNKYLPPEIVIYEIREAPEDMHARFDAKLRGYTYRMIFRKNPFLKNLTYYYPYPNRPDFEKMQEAANLLLGYSVFFPFCKSNSDAKTMNCRLQKAIWKQVDNTEEEEWQFHIEANRFLRGMVRLIVGMCVNVGTGKLSLEEVKSALDNQRRLTLDLSVPAGGLYLSKVVY